MSQRPAMRPVLLPCLLLVTIACLCFSVGGGFVAPGSFRSSASQAVGSKRQSRTELFARGGATDGDDDDDDDGDDSVEVSGFSGFVIGLAFLPHVCYALYTAFNVATQGQNFELGPYGLEAISCTVSVGLLFWSLGSFLGRGRGLPAGPLGLLGLSEGLSYLAALGLAIAAAVTSVRTGGAGAPSPPKVSAPSAPQISMPKAPEIKAPDIKVPAFQMPDVKVPEFKAPDIKVPEIKAPDIKLPEAPKPAPAAPKKEEPKPTPPPPKKEEAPAPKPAPPPPPPAPKKEEAKPPPPPAPKPKAEPKAEPKAADYADLFD